MFLTLSCSCLCPIHWSKGVSIENEDVVGAAPTSDAPTTSEWSTILLLSKVWLILEVWQYIFFTSRDHVISSISETLNDEKNIYPIMKNILLIMLTIIIWITTFGTQWISNDYMAHKLMQAIYIRYVTIHWGIPMPWYFVIMIRIDTVNPDNCDTQEIIMHKYSWNRSIKTYTFFTSDLWK